MINVASKILNLSIDEGVRTVVKFKVVDRLTGFPIDLTNFAVEAQIRSDYDSHLLLRKSTSNNMAVKDSEGNISFEISYYESSLLPKDCVYDVFLLDLLSNDTYKVFYGLMYVTPAVTLFDGEEPSIPPEQGGGGPPINEELISHLTHNIDELCSYNDVTTKLFTTIPAGAYIDEIQVIVVTSFDVPTPFSVGYTGNQESIVALDETDLTFPAGTVFEITPKTNQFAEATETYFYKAASGATQGQVRVIVSYSVPR